ncbi:Hypothetical predicted protein [Octopus vulgaris]|uniref:DUF7041 domain-containing protein n=1 Tax=Octopus vulgaris TaxID=6645 RepID=A0AA36B7F1_OCTVU|nr:Hypothetical predicted protein [Octopus vulgaris]
MDHFPLPQYRGDAKIWFSQLQSFFMSFNIHSAQSKLHITLTGIPSPLAISVRDMIAETPSDMTYETVKAEAFRSNSPVESKFRTLLQDEHLGDRTSTQFLRRIRKLSDSSYERQAFAK